MNAKHQRTFWANQAWIATIYDEDQLPCHICKNDVFRPASARWETELKVRRFRWTAKNLSIVTKAMAATWLQNDLMIVMKI